MIKLYLGLGSAFKIFTATQSPVRVNVCVAEDKKVVLQRSNYTLAWGQHVKFLQLLNLLLESMFVD